jgi:hypothetical protein
MKAWRPTLEAHVRRWARRLQARWIPRYVYHFTDVQNAAEILRSGELLSRHEANRRSVMRNDNAAPDVLENTPAAHTKFARLYFRPRTPTQFHNEGIRALDHRYHGAHCPVPVFLAFDLVDTISIDHVAFSNGNMASGQVRFSDAEDFFGSLPFDLIYHDAPLAPEERSTIVFHRHAEVLVPNRLEIAPTLKWILCRSHAERETLLYLLGDARGVWEQKVRVGDQKLFFADQVYVDTFEVDSIAESAVFRMKIPTGRTARLRFELQSASSRKRWTWSHDAWSLPVLTLTVRNAETGLVRLWIEDCLAYAAIADYADIPF